MNVVFWITGIIATILVAMVEHQGRTNFRPPLKLTAAGAFLAIGFSGQHATLSEQLMMAGLVFGFIGDAALLSQKKKPFLFGIGAFLIGHALYALAWLPSFTPSVLLDPRSILFLLLAIGFTPFIVTYTEGFMKIAVISYIVVITIMGITSVGHSSSTGDSRYLIGAAMFALSDVSVALDRFTPIPRWHRWFGIPLYFISQYILASTLAPIS